MFGMITLVVVRTYLQVRQLSNLLLKRMYAFVRFASCPRSHGSAVLLPWGVQPLGPFPSLCGKQTAVSANTAFLLSIM